MPLRRTRARELYDLMYKDLIPFWMNRGGVSSGALLTADGYLCLIVRKDWVAQVAETYFPKVITRPCTWEWKGKLAGNDTSRIFYVGFGEEAPGQVYDSICARLNGAQYEFNTFAGSLLEQTILSGQDWTVERKFKVEWTAASVKLYVDDVLVATHTTRNPSTPLIIFGEISNEGVTHTAHGYLYLKDWKKLA